MPTRTDTVLVGRILRDARKDAGLSQEELAPQLGISQPALSRYELGQVEDFGLRTIARFCEVLNIDPVEITGPFFTKKTRGRRQPLKAAS